MCFFSHPCLDKNDALSADSQNLEHAHMSFELCGSVVPIVCIVEVHCDLKAVVRKHTGNVDKSITSMLCRIAATFSQSTIKTGDRFFGQTAAARDEEKHVFHVRRLMPRANTGRKYCHAHVDIGYCCEIMWQRAIIEACNQTFRP